MNRHLPPSNNRRPSRSTLAGILLAAASAVALAAPSVPATGSSASPADRPCFMVRPHWNSALDGPQPVCPLPR